MKIKTITSIRVVSVKVLILLALFCTGLCVFSQEEGNLKTENLLEFTDSVKFIPGQEAVRMSLLKGKNVLVLFYQIKCPKCSVWSGNLLREIEKAHGENPYIQLVLICTDSRSADDAFSYLKKRNLNFRKWIIACDITGEYGRKYFDNPSFYKCVISNPEGRILSARRAGQYSEKKNNDRDIRGYLVGRMNIPMICWDEKPLSFTDSDPDALKKINPEIACNIELLRLRVALAALDEAIKNSSESGSEVIVRSDILKFVEATLQKLCNEFYSESCGQERKRAIAFQVMRIIVETRDYPEIRGNPISQKTHDIFRKVKPEIQAFDSYRVLIRDFRNSDTAVYESFRELSERFKGTYFGVIAANDYIMLKGVGEK